MRLKISLFLLLLISFAVNYWLWGWWSFVTEPPWLSTIFLLNSIFIIFLVLIPVIFLLRKKTLKGLFGNYVLRGIYVVVVLTSMILTLSTIWWVRAYLFPFQMGFVIYNTYLFAKKKQWITSKRG